MRKNVSHEYSQEIIIQFVQNFPFSRLGIEDSQRFINNPKKFCNLFAENITGKNTDVFPQETSHLRLVGTTTISATKTGIGMSQKNRGPFTWVDPDFDNIEAQTVSKDTQEVEAHVYEQIQDGTFITIFGSFNRSLDLLSFETHEQIKDFVEHSPELLHPKGHPTYLLYKNKDGDYFVACVSNLSTGNGICVCDFSRDTVWSADSTHRFVVLTT